MSKSASLSNGSEWARLMSGSKILPDDRHSTAATAPVDPAKATVPWSGVAAGVTKAKASDAPGSGSSRSKGSVALTPGTSRLKATNGGGVFALSASAGGSGILGKKTTPHSSSGSNNTKLTEPSPAANQISPEPQTTAEPTGPAESAEPSEPKERAEIPTNADGRKYTPEELLVIWKNMSAQQLEDNTPFNSSVRLLGEQKLDEFSPLGVVPVPEVSQPMGSFAVSPAARSAAGRYRVGQYYSHSASGPVTLEKHVHDAFSAPLESSAYTNDPAAAPSPVITPGAGQPGSSRLVNLRNATPTDQWSPFGSLTAANGSNVSALSPRVSSMNLTGKQPDLFSSPLVKGITSAATPPPGLGSPQPLQLLGPDTSQWLYRDPTGVERGPFTGRTMHEWYEGNWLSDDLLIRRAEEHEYIRLHDYKVRISNFTEPFLVPIPVSRPAAPPGFADHHMLQGQQAIPQPFVGLHLQQTSSGLASPNGSWAGLSSPAPQVASPWMQPHPVSIQSPFAQDSFWSSSPRLDSPTASSPAPGSAVRSEQDQAPETLPIQPQPIQPIRPLQDSAESARSKVRGAAKAPLDPISAAISAAVDSPVTESSPIAPPSPTPASKSAVEKAEAHEAKRRVASKSKGKAQEALKELPKEPTLELSKNEAVEVANESKEEQGIDAYDEADASSKRPTLAASSIATPATSAAPSLAPWAKKEEPKVAPLSLKEIQELEAVERKKQQALEQQQQQLVAQQLASRFNASPRPISMQPSLPSTAIWANAGSTLALPKKTLADIQREEQLEAAKKKPSVPSTAQILGGGGFAGLSKPAARPAAASAASAAPAPGGAWTTVGPGGRKVSSAGISSGISSPVAASPAPVGLKIMPSPVRPVATPSDEFLQWCKTSLTGLNSGVNPSELLTILFSLPGSADSKEIIADTIYSNSSTMDGRRFADEFLSRRAAADELHKTGENWSDVLQRAVVMSDVDPNDGWNPAFKVVSKKKGKRGD